MFWVKGKLTDCVVTWVFNKEIPDFQSSITEQKVLQHAILGWKYTVFWGLRSVLSAKMTNVQLWSHFVTTFLLVLEVFLLHCIKFPEKLSSTLEFKTNTFSIPKHNWVHFYFSKHYFMAIRKHKYQTDEHIKCVTTVAIYDMS